jgi:hypothetical protein
VGSERRGWRRGDGTGRPRDREGTKKLKNSINISRRIVIGKRGWGVGNIEGGKFVMAIDGEGFSKEIGGVKEGTNVGEDKHVLFHAVAEPIPA